MTEKVESVEQTATYAGVREASNGKLAQAWIVNGEELWFSKPIGQVVGGIYVLQMTPDRKRAYTKSQRYTMERIDDREQIAAWELADRRVKNKRKRAAAERKHKANGVLDDATYSIDRITRSLKTVDEAHALGDLLRQHVIDEFWRSRG
jgi:hypothetical protein